MKDSSPLALTVTLSLATLLGYAAYRILYTADGETPPDHAGHEAATIDGRAPLPETLPDVALANLEGTTTPIDSWSGRPMVVNFWATWCAPCLREIPLLKQFQQDEPGVRVIGVAIDREEPVREFAAEMGFNYPILIGQSDAMDLATAFGVDVFVMPYTVFTAASGATLGYHAGELHRAQLTDLAATLAALEAGQLDLNAARARVAGLR